MTCQGMTKVSIAVALLSLVACKKTNAAHDGGQNDDAAALLDAASESDAATPTQNACLENPTDLDPWFRCMPTLDGRAAVGSVAYRDNGNIVLAGAYNGTVAVSPEHSFAPSSEGIFALELDTSGVIQWTAVAYTRADYAGVSVAVAADGMVYLSGTFQGAIIFTDRLMLEQDEHALMTDVFTAKIDPQNGFLWARRWGVSGTVGVGNMVTTDDNGVIVTGLSSGDIGPAMHADGNVILKYSPTGSQQWLITTPSEALAPRIHELADGDNLVVGFLRAGSTLNDETFDDARYFAVKIADDGTIRWVHTWSKTMNDGGGQPFAFGELQSGHLLLAGYVGWTNGLTSYGSLTFDNAVMAEVNEPSLYFAELDAEGNALTLETIGTEGDFGLLTGSVDSDGTVVAGGWYGEALRIGTTMLPADNIINTAGIGLAMRFSQHGEVLSALRLESHLPSGAQINTAVAGPGGRVAIAGHYTTDISFNGTFSERSRVQGAQTSAFVLEGTNVLRD